MVLNWRWGQGKMVRGRGGHHRYRRKKNTGDKTPGGIRKVVNPHTQPVCAKIAKISGGKREPTQDGAIGLGHHPTQANAGDRCGGGEQAASPDEVYGPIIDSGEAARNRCGRAQSPAVATSKGSQHSLLRFLFGSLGCSQTR